MRLCCMVLHVPMVPNLMASDAAFNEDVQHVGAVTSWLWQFGHSVQPCSHAGKSDTLQLCIMTF